MGHRGGDETAVEACGTVEKREVVESLRLRGHLLTGRDRALLEMYLEHGNSLRQIGRLTGSAHGTVGRRIRGLLRRITDDTYEICLGNRDEFNGRELAMIKDHFVDGLSERCISRTRGATLYRVKTTFRKARLYAARTRRGNR